MSARLRAAAKCDGSNPGPDPSRDPGPGTRTERLSGVWKSQKKQENTPKQARGKEGEEGERGAGQGGKELTSVDAEERDRRGSRVGFGGLRVQQARSRVSSR